MLGPSVCYPTAPAVALLAYESNRGTVSATDPEVRGPGRRARAARTAQAQRYGKLGGMAPPPVIRKTLLLLASVCPFYAVQPLSLCLSFHASVDGLMPGPVTVLCGISLRSCDPLQAAGAGGASVSGAHPARAGEGGIAVFCSYLLLNGLGAGIPGSVLQRRDCAEGQVAECGRQRAGSHCALAGVRLATGRLPAALPSAPSSFWISPLPPGPRAPQQR